MNEPRQALVSIPPDVRCAQDYEALATHFMAGPTHAYVAGGSGRDRTVAANLAAFRAWEIWPRLLHDARASHTRVQLPGHDLAHPLLLAPLAFQRLAHPQAELATARAAEAADATLIASTLSSERLEDIARLSGAGKWFQLYLQPRRDDSLSLLRRAEAAGYQAIVLTLDAPVQTPSLQALRAGFCLPADCLAANLQDQLPVVQPALEPGQSRVFQSAMRHAPGWPDLDWLLDQSRLPVWVKGVLHAQDAQDLRKRGVAGLIVSNHGGRGLDGAPASLRALPQVRRAVGSDYPLLLDGGIRSGSDVFKALALGANAVLIGRLQMYALSVAGALGVAHLLMLLREELELCMALAGCASPQDIHADCLLPALLSDNPIP